MPVIPTGYAQFNITFSGPNCPTGAEVTLAADVNTAFEPVAYAQSVHEKWAAEIQPFLDQDAALTSVLCKFGPNDLGPSAEYTDIVAGSAVGEAGAPNTALLVRKLTAAGGRPNRGRMFVPGVVEGNYDTSGIIATGALATYNTAFGDLYDSLVTDGILPVVLHGVGSPVSVPTPITGFSVSALMATQRRRLRR